MRSISTYKAGLAIIFLAFFVKVHAQQTFSPGTVTIFNHKTDSGTIKPVPGAQVDDDYQRVQPTMTDDKGYFGLFIYGVKEKTRFSFRVVKDGWEVVNIDALNPIAGQLDTVRISMALPGQATVYRRELYHTGETNNEKRLAGKIAKNDELIQKHQAKEKVDSVLIDSLRREMAFYKQQKENSGANAAQFVERYGSIDLDYATQEFQKAFKLFKTGLVDSALEVMRIANPRASLAKDAREADSLTAAEAEIHRNKVGKIARKKSDIVDIQLEADMFTTNLQYDSALACYQTLIQYDSGRDKNYFQAAYFYNYFHKPDSAIKYYQLAIAHSADTAVITGALNNLAGLWETNELFELAKGALQLAVRLNEGIWQQSSLNQQDYAMSLANFGHYYFALNHYDEAEGYYLKALSVYSAMVTLPIEAQRGRITTETNLGTLYGNSSNFSKAIGYLDSAIRHEELLLHQQVDRYNPELASISLSLSNIYLKAGEYENARQLLVNLSGQYDSLSLNEKIANISQYGRLEYDLGQWASQTRHYDEARVYLRNSLVIRRDLYTKFPGTFDYDYVLVLSAMGQLYQQIHMPDSGREMMKKALDVISIHQKIRASAFEIERANALSVMASFLKIENDLAAAIKYSEEAVTIYENMASDRPIYISERLVTLDMLGIMYYYDDQFSKAVKVLKKAISLFPMVPKPHYSRFDEISENVYSNLGLYLEDFGLSDSAKPIMDSARDICQRMKSKGTPLGAKWARLNTSYGNYYLDKDSAFKAREKYFEAYNYYVGVVGGDTTEYEPLISDREVDLGNAYGEISTDSAKYFYLQAKQIIQKYYKISYKQYGRQMGIVCNNLGALAMNQRPIPDFASGKDYFSQAREANIRLDSLYPNHFDSVLVSSDFGLGMAELNLGEMSGAKAAFTEIVSICRRPDARHSAFLSNQLRMAIEQLRKIDMMGGLNRE